MTDAFCEPRPDPPPPILIAGEGEQYLLRAVARHADWWLSYGHRVEVLKRKLEVLADHCRAGGAERRRDPEGDAAHGLPEGVGRGGATLGWGRGRSPSSPPSPATPSELRDCLTELRELGFEMIQLRFAGLMGTEDVALFVDRVLPHFR